MGERNRMRETINRERSCQIREETESGEEGIQQGQRRRGRESELQTEREIERGWASKEYQPKSEICTFRYEDRKKKKFTIGFYCKRKLKRQLLGSINYRFHHDLTRLRHPRRFNILTHTHTVRWLDEPDTLPLPPSAPSH